MTDIFGKFGKVAAILGVTVMMGGCIPLFHDLFSGSDTPASAANDLMPQSVEQQSQEEDTGEENPTDPAQLTRAQLTKACRSRSLSRDNEIADQCRAAGIVPAASLPQSTTGSLMRGVTGATRSGLGILRP